MTSVKSVSPTNFQSEYQKFMSDPTKNPQFIYKTPLDTNQLTEHGCPSSQYLELAQRILDKSFFARNEADLVNSQGAICNFAQVKKTSLAFIKLNKLEEHVSVKFSQSFQTRATMSTALLLKLRLPLDFRKEGLIGMLYHEVGTHALRTINFQRQPWYEQRGDFSLANYLKTEEGLASIHSLIAQSLKVNYFGALRYLSVSWAQQGSFVEVWQKIGKYIQNPTRRWLYTTRVKRGLTDTSLPGGFTKDLVYFEGFVQVWQWLKNHNYDPSPLYYGKISLQDIEKVVGMQPDYRPQLPSFYISSPKIYAKAMKEIGAENMLE